ncbi:MAG TPA: gamma carbonic anhydrase family protein, partial [Pseudolabrys sp.]|nr:gamma carbonic anhydrase family protein [Pseudolabrys sp.]
MPIYELDGQRPEFPGEGEYWVAETATLIGRVRLKRASSVWFGAVLRGDNEWIELGERSQIQDNSTLHTDPGFPMVIGRNCVIGHNVVLHGCTIGDNSLIGSRAGPRCDRSRNCCRSPWGILDRCAALNCPGSASVRPV